MSNWISSRGVLFQSFSRYAICQFCNFTLYIKDEQNYNINYFPQRNHQSLVHPTKILQVPPNECVESGTNTTKKLGYFKMLKKGRLKADYMKKHVSTMNILKSKQDILKIGTNLYYLLSWTNNQGVRHAPSACMQTSRCNSLNTHIFYFCQY